MILTDEQKAMLDGKYGEGAAYAMKIQVGIGECFDAERMVPIKRAHVALSNQAGDLWFAEKLVKAGAHCRVAPTVNPGFCTGHFTGACAHPADPEDIAHMLRTERSALSPNRAPRRMSTPSGARAPTARAPTAHCAPPSPAACPNTVCCSMKTARATSLSAWKPT